MRLAEWLREHDLSYRQFGRHTSIDGSNIRRYCLDFDHPARQIPDEKRMIAIYRATGGQVAPNDFYALPALEAAAGSAAGAPAAAACIGGE